MLLHIIICFKLLHDYGMDTFQEAFQEKLMSEIDNLVASGWEVSGQQHFKVDNVWVGHTML